jgi:acyl-CoA synthetase (AMP-forming)/AMP-acid ligase II
LIHFHKEYRFKEIIEQKSIDLAEVKSGDVVALIGDFNPKSILILLQLIEKKAIIVPLTNETKLQHEYFFNTALVDFVIKDSSIKRLKQTQSHQFINKLRKQNHGGLIAFSTGTTGRPKAILHDLTLYMKRFETPRPTLKTINFLLFDHLGGLNTLFHTLFNKGTIVAPKSRNIDDILDTCALHKVEVLPATPTFLRLMLLSGLVPEKVPKCLKIITYGTERMDQPTLDALCEQLPKIDFRQTYGMTELGVVRVKSKARDSLFMKIGGEGVKTRVVNNILEINSETRMLGYLNEDSPFDEKGWYNTKDLVEQQDGFYKIIGRSNEVINVGGLKFLASEVERVALRFKGVEFAKAEGRTNPITGQHVELIVQPIKKNEIDKIKLKDFLSKKLPKHMTPKRLKISLIKVSHRFKKI